ncbi:DUF3560 domain-containing protein [Microbacterium sp. B2969]|uniref:DUF3560 domain-containing protein n=1 Tax=Microbacterium alkaliflavum TaxID=3248839 RepID=A0ABW7QDV2_9MICO
MTALTITHTAAAGTLLEGTNKGDGSAEILRGTGWRWSARIASWYVPRSRDRAPSRHLIARTAQLLEEAGFEVEVEIDATPRSASDVEQDRHDRAAQRVDELTARAAHQGDRAQQSEAVARRIADGIPFGQPILVGHHSEARHRRDLARAQRARDIEHDARTQQEDLERRAAATAAADAARSEPRAVARRISTLETQLRKITRSIEGYRNHLGDQFPPASGDQLTRLRDELAHVDEDLAHWTRVRAQQIADGSAIALTRDDVACGDLVAYRGQWFPVLRVNAKSVSVRSLAGGSWTDTIPYHQISGHRPKQV